MIGMAIAQGLAEHKQPGAVHMLDTYDAWYPGYIDYNPIFKNIPSFWTETAGASAIPEQRQRRPTCSAQPKALYTDPFPGGEWHLRDAVEYDETAALSVLEYAAKYKESLLYGRYQSGMRSDREGPSAGAVRVRDSAGAARSRRRRRAAAAARVQRRARVPADGADGASTAPTLSGRARGSSRPIRSSRRSRARCSTCRCIRTCASSPDGPLDQPYDAAGWTLPLSMGVTVTTAADAAVGATCASKMRLLGSLPEPKAKPTPYNLTTSAGRRAVRQRAGRRLRLEPERGRDRAAGREDHGLGPALALDPAQNNTFRALNRAWKAGVDVQFARAGRVPHQRAVRDDQDELVKSLALSARARQRDRRRPSRSRASACSTRRRAWTRAGRAGCSTSTASSTRAWLPTDIQAGRAARQVDVLLLADDGGSAIAGGGRGGGRGGGGGCAVAAAARGAGGGPPAGPAPSTPTA